MTHLLKRQLGRALYQAVFWALVVTAMSKAYDLGLIDDKKVEAIAEAAREYLNLYSLIIFAIVGLVMVGVATFIRPLRARVGEIFVEETCATFGIACALAGASWLYVFLLGVANSGIGAVYQNDRWNTGELSFLLLAACAYLTLLVVIPVGGTFLIRSVTSHPVPKAQIDTRVNGSSGP